MCHLIRCRFLRSRFLSRGKCSTSLVELTGGGPSLTSRVVRTIPVELDELPGVLINVISESHSSDDPERQTVRVVPARPYEPRVYPDEEGCPSRGLESDRDGPRSLTELSGSSPSKSLGSFTKKQKVRQVKPTVLDFSRTGSNS